MAVEMKRMQNDGLEVEEPSGEVVIPISNGDTVSIGTPIDLQYFAVKVCYVHILHPLFTSRLGEYDRRSSGHD